MNVYACDHYVKNYFNIWRRFDRGIFLFWKKILKKGSYQLHFVTNIAINCYINSISILDEVLRNISGTFDRESVA